MTRQLTSQRSFETHTPQETLALGQHIGRVLEANTIITLEGELGAGKTWLAKGIAFGLGVPDHEYVNSPAYDIVHEYNGRLQVYHVDLYRLDTLSTEDKLMIEELYKKDAVCLIEWASRLKQYDAYPKQYLAVTITMPDLDQENYRQIELIGYGTFHADIVRSLGEVSS